MHRILDLRRLKALIEFTRLVSRILLQKTPITIKRQTPHSTLPIPIPPPPILLRILLKHPINIDTRPHRTRLTILRDIILQVSRRNSSSIIAKLVVEMLEVVEFVAPDQLFGKVEDTVEREVEDLFAGFDAIVEGCSGEGTLAPGYACCVGGEEGGVGVGDHAAYVVAYYMDWVFDVEVVWGRDEGMQVCCEGGFEVAAERHGTGGVAATTIVWDNGPVARSGEEGNDVAKLVGCLRPAVD